MKFEFRNLGTIKRTTLDLRPLTVIVGPNNSSKTYLAYCLHGMIRELPLAGFRFMPSEPGNGVANTPVSVPLSSVATRTRAKSAAAMKRFTRRLAEHFQDSYGGIFRSTKLGLQISDEDIEHAIYSVASSMGDRLRLSGDSLICQTFPALRDDLERVAENASVDVLEHLAGQPLTLPAERNALIISYKILSARRYRILRDRERTSYVAKRSKTALDAERAALREQGDIRYPAPIEDFLDFLTDTEIDSASPPNDSRTAFGKLANLIETQLQGGQRTVYHPTVLGGAELVLTVNEDLKIDLYNASSSIKQIAPLLLYLRYRAAPNQTLIIDEPEMNLHPEGQAKLLEALGMLANLGVRVLLTTHSPYFMAHLNNLIAADSASPARKKRQAKHLYMEDPAAFLSPDDVSAYEMRPDGLHSLKDAEYGVRWDTLSDVSAELQRRYYAIVEEPKSRGAKAK
ncbi:MAG: ATP-binding protein [Polyangiaceae bacterium]